MCDKYYANSKNIIDNNNIINKILLLILLLLFIMCDILCKYGKDRTTPYGKNFIEIIQPEKKCN